MSIISKFDRPVAGGNRQMEWTSDVAAEMLRRLGIKYVALNPGASYRGFHDSLVNYLGNQDPQMLLCLHEDHAISVAHGYAKVTEEPMGSIVHSNVGLMHGLMGMFNAWCDRAPVYVMGATGPVDAPLRRPWIDWIHTAKDQGALLRNFVKYDDEPRSAEAIVESMLRAFILGRTAPKGPTYICLDAGLQETKLSKPVNIPDIGRFDLAAAPHAAPDVVNRVLELVLGAKKPVILMGRVSRKPADWALRQKFAELIGAKVITDLKSSASFPTDHPLHIGPPSNWVREAGKVALAEAEVILALDWIDLAGTFKACGFGYNVKAKVVHCTVDQYAHNGWSADHFGLAATDVPVLAEPDAFVAQLCAEAERRLQGKPRWTGRYTPASDPGMSGTKAGSSTIAPRDIAFALNEVKGRRQVTLSRVPLGWAGDAYQFRGPLDYLGNDGGGGLGSGAGNAIGVGLALLDSGRIPMAILGDGDFMQGGSALWTAAHYKIPALFVISNNRSNFNDEVHQETMARDRKRPLENRWIGQRIDEPAIDLAAYARSQGVSSLGPVDKVGELPAAFEKGLKAVEQGEPFFIDVRVEPGYSAPMGPRASGEAS
jgi:thiamine pyrophosphate-dependent acetolactate synthase large subunit-like protein